MTYGKLQAVWDGFYAQSKVFTIDVDEEPAKIERALTITRAGGVATNFDPEGLAYAPDGSLWVASEGNLADSRANRLIKVNPVTGVVEREVGLPAAVVAVPHRRAHQGGIVDPAATQRNRHAGVGLRRARHPAQARRRLPGVRGPAARVEFHHAPRRATPSTTIPPTATRWSRGGPGSGSSIRRHRRPRRGATSRTNWNPNRSTRPGSGCPRSRGWTTAGS